jgi:hypothetical protein
MVIWYIFSQFGILYQEKSGNPGAEQLGADYGFLIKVSSANDNVPRSILGY